LTAADYGLRRYQTQPTPTTPADAFRNQRQQAFDSGYTRANIFYQRDHMVVRTTGFGAV
jgi:hypothetical protein